MKKIYSILLCIGLIAGFISCEKDRDFTLSTLSLSDETIIPSYESAAVSCVLKANSTISDAYVHYSVNSNFADYSVAKMTKEKGKYIAELVDLLDNTMYYIRYEANNKYSSVVTDDIAQFQTLELSLPVMDIDTISNVYDSYAQAHIRLSFDGGTPVTEMGVCWNTQANPTIDNDKATTEDAVAIVDITALQPNTTYYARAYAKNKLGVSYSREMVITTYALPEVRTEEVADIQLRSAQLVGTLLFTGNDDATTKGFCWSDKPEPTIEGNHIQIDVESESYTYLLDNLVPETQYYVRAYAQNMIGTVYGEEKIFTTLPILLATLTTTAATDITTNSAVVGGNITEDGGDNLTERGVVYSTSHNPTTSNTKIISGAGIGSFTCNLTDLQDNTTYYVRAYAVNSKGVAYGDEVSFTTASYSLPSVTTTSASSVTTSSATVGGNVTADGGATVTERGVVYSTTQNPTTSNSKKVSGSGKGAFSVSLTGLLEGRTYYVRAYAVNSEGTSYGNQISFTTNKTVVLPTVTTTTATQITETTAVTGGNVTADGNATVTERGVVYSTTQNPTTSNSKKVSGSGIGSFTCNLTGLQANTTYYVRAYAVNSKGTAYGQEISFTTDKGILLPVLTTTVTQITNNSAVVVGNITSDGGATVTERGIVYCQLPNPDINHTNAICDIIRSGSGVGEFTCEMIDLPPDTKYYVRAYAINSKGVAYGEEVSFTTASDAPAVPEYVDLGLSVKWATFNVGANKPEDYGDYFAWGETEPKTIYEWSTYKWCNGSHDTQTKYCTDSSYGTVDNKTVLDKEDDAAAVNWGGNWQMPTEAEFYELREQCTWTWTTQNGVDGYNVTSKKNGNSIFLPAAGYRYGSSLYYAGSGGYYWSSSLNSYDASYAYYLYFNSSYVDWSNYLRFYGRSVRPVYGLPVVTVPTVTTSVVTQITETTAVAGGNVTSDGGATVTERGVCVATVSNPTTSNAKVTAGSGTGSFTCDLTGLQANTTYYIRAYAINSKGVAYGEEVSFTTKSTSYSDPTGTANGHGYVDLGLSVKWATCNVGASKPEDYGDYFAWGETEPKTIYEWSTYKWCEGHENALTKYNNDISSGIVDNKMTIEPSDDAATVNWGGGTGGGTWRIPTSAEQDELREQCTWTWTIQNGVKGYKVTSKKNGNSIFLPAAGYRAGSLLYDAGINGNLWSSSLEDTNCWCLAYFLGFDSGDVARYGDRRFFGRSVRPVYGLPVVIVPSVTTSAVTQITEATAVAGGNVTADGGASVTERGIVYSTSSNPMITNLSSTIVRSGSGVGEFNCNLTNLQPSTTYYVRAYAINNQGTAYGEERTFTTSKQITLASVMTNAITQITEATAVAGGNVTSDGGATVTERGVCVATVSNPTTSNAKVTAGSGTGSFTCNLTGLQANTTYYVRAYAINSKGTAYGTEVSFTTNKSVVLPTVTTSTITQFTQTTAVAGGNVTSDGNGTVTERGVCVATVSNPTTSHAKVTAGSGTGSFTCNLTGLQENTTYYVRAYAVNSKGTAYGTEVSFTTKKQPSTSNEGIPLTNEDLWEMFKPYYNAYYGLNRADQTIDKVVVFASQYMEDIMTNPVSEYKWMGDYILSVATKQGYTIESEADWRYSVQSFFNCVQRTSWPQTADFSEAGQPSAWWPYYPNSGTPNNGTENGHGYVDLGLSVKWATCNVGANASEEYGDYFAWGETEPKTTYDWSNYKWCNGSETTLTKYNTNSDFGIVDNKTTLELSDDAAHVNWGGSWRIPTYAELLELRDQCTWTWTTQNGVDGYNVTSKKNGNSIFLPAAGLRGGSSVYDAGSYGFYLSSSLDTYCTSIAYGLYFGSSSVDLDGKYSRYYGHSVRPVCPQKFTLAFGNKYNLLLVEPHANHGETIAKYRRGSNEVPMKFL